MNKNILIIDIGNTNTVFSIYNGFDVISSWRLSTKIDRTSDEYTVWLKSMIKYELNDNFLVKDVVIGTVVPAVIYELKKMCVDNFNLNTLIIGDDIILDIPTNVDNSKEVGTDRLVNSLAAWKKYEEASIVVDFGTATTFDIIDSTGTYIGGIIAPGVNLSLEALHLAAARLPRIAVAKPKSLIGKNTLVAMQSGIYWGYIGLIEGIINRIIIEKGERMNVVATGGLAPMFSSSSELIKDVDENLTIFGMYEAYKIYSLKNNA